MIRRADRLDDVAARAEVGERLEPAVESRADRLHVLQVPAVDLAGAVVDVEVDVELGARGGIAVAGEVLGHPRSRPEQSLLFAAPQRDANRPPRPRADRLQDPHRLDHRRRAVGVVGGADAGVPRIEVAADHHDLVAQRRIGARQLREDVVGVAAVGVVERRLHVDAQLHRDVVLQHAGDHVVVLGAERHRRHGARTAVASGDEDRSVLAGARLQHHRRAGITHHLGHALRRARACTAAASLIADRRGVGGGVRHVAWIRGLRPILADEVGHDWLGHDDRAFELGAHRGDRLGRLAAEEDRRRDDLTVGRRGPAVRVADER